MALSDGSRSKRHWWMLALSAVSLTLTAVFSTPSWRWASALIGLGLQFMYCVAEEATADPPAGSGGRHRAATSLFKGAAGEQHAGGSGSGGGAGGPNPASAPPSFSGSLPAAPADPLQSPAPPSLSGRRRMMTLPFYVAGGG